MARKEGPKPIRIFTKSLRSELADEERRDMAIDLAGEQGRLQSARVEKEESTKAHNAAIKTAEARVDELAVAVNQGWVYRDVEVHEYDDFDGKRVYHVRVDTGETIFERPMNEQERQRPLIEA